jgi:lipopolysaccharide/colanic/teichoic acid biosynthesis glycosyltransferase
LLYADLKEFAVKSPSSGVDALSKTRLKWGVEKGNYSFVKRALDLSLCILTVPLTLPLMAICALAVRLDSPGPVLFVQERVGKGGRLFRMYKFRTYCLDDSSHRAFMKVNDKIYKPVRASQVTRVGRILRKTSLDQLPQVFNVLKGEMSLIGPWPNVPLEVEVHQLWHYRRPEVLPGITGLAQIRGRSSTSFDSIAKYDIEYIENQNLALDLRILWQAILLLIIGKDSVLIGVLEFFWLTISSVIRRANLVRDGHTSSSQSSVLAPPHTSTERSKLIEAFAIARFRDHSRGQPFRIGLEYVLEVGTSRTLRQGFEVAPFTLQMSGISKVFDIVVYAEDMDVSPSWLQQCTFNSDQENLIEFIIVPRATGRKAIRIEFYYQSHWLQQISFMVEVIEI